MKQAASKILLVFVVFASLFGAGAYLYFHRHEQSTDDAAIAGRTVMMSPKVSGYVIELNVSDNQLVKQGDILLEIDPSDYLIKRDRAAAMLEAATAAAEAGASSAETTNVSAPSNLDAATAQAALAQAEWDRAQSDLKRMQKLSNEARSQEQLEKAVAAEKAAHSNFDAAQAKLRAAEAAPQIIAQAKSSSESLVAHVKEAEAALEQAELDLGNTKVIAPADGRVTKRGVERGNFVQPGQALMALVSRDMWVVANFKETQLRHMRPGQPVKIGIDAYPDVKLSGKVESIQAGTGAYFSAFPPENATGNFVKIVQRVPVKIVFDQAPEEALAMGPGMSVVPTVDTSTGRD
jgi:membrane fusion protein (multidrug efflux system)